MEKKIIRARTNAQIQGIVLTKILIDGAKAYESIVVDNNIDEEYFDEGTLEAFKYIRDYYDKFNETPMISAFEQRFPDFSFKEYENDADNSYSALVQELQNNFWQKQLAILHTLIGRNITDSDNARENALRYADIINQYLNLTSPTKYTQTNDLITLVKNNLAYTRENRTKKFYPTGVDGLEDLHGWDKDADYVVVAGRTGDGKSMMCCKFASELLRQGRRVVYYTGEMPKVQIMHRMISALTGISSLALLNANDYIDEQLMSFLDNEFSKYHFTLVDKSDFGHKEPTAKDLEFVCNKVSAEALFIDQQSLMRDIEKAKVSWEKYANISRQIKALRDKLNILVITAVQLNRMQSEESNSAQVAGSDVIAQDATKILFVKYKKETNEFGLSIVKNRSGRTGAKIKYIVDFDKCSFRRPEDVEDEVKGEQNINWGK